MALDAQRIAAIEQAKLNAICNKLLHSRTLPQARSKNTFVDWAGFAIPSLVIIATLMVFRLGGGDLAITLVADVLSAIILVLTSVKLYYGWQKQVEDHASLLADNMSIIREASALLDRRTSASNAEAQWFLRHYDEVERRSIEMFGELPVEVKQHYYRESLKEFDPNSRCRTCNASPFTFTPGPCQTCGGTPSPRTGANP